MQSDSYYNSSAYKLRRINCHQQYIVFKEGLFCVWKLEVPLVRLTEVPRKNIHNGI